MLSTLSGLGNKTESENLPFRCLRLFHFVLFYWGLMNLKETEFILCFYVHCACYVERTAELLIFRSRNDVV